MRRSRNSATRRIAPAFLGTVILFWLGTALLSTKAFAEPVLQVERLSDNAFALIGPITNRDPVNLGNNANFGVIVTDDGVVLIDAGATQRGAQMIHDAVRSITDKPVRYVINTGGQDHRWLGNAYFKSIGARVIASEDAVADQRARLGDQLRRLEGLVGPEGIEGTQPDYADEAFAEQKTLEVGGTRIEIHHPGHAHTPGDSFVWLPQQRILFSGDIVYVDRLLSIGPQSAHRSWIAAFEALAAKEPDVVVPGHGQASDLARATRDTYDYLVFLREAVSGLIDEGGGMEDLGSIDQSAFAYLDNYESLKGRNAQRVFDEVEWE
jgi:glyoxylase-like metal-dependent hydrolase (beta-lactamase superfamily II)